MLKSEKIKIVLCVIVENICV